MLELASSLQVRAQALAAASGESAYQLLMAAADAERSRLNGKNGNKSPGRQVNWTERVGMDPVEFLMMVGLLQRLNPRVSRLKICKLVAAAAAKIEPSLRHEKGHVGWIKNLISKPERRIAAALARRIPLTPPYLPGFAKSELKAIASHLPPEFG